MSLIIYCGKCDRRMGSLEEHRIRDDKYICVKCFDALEKEQKAIQNIYDNVPDNCIPWSFGVWIDPANLPSKNIWNSEYVDSTEITGIKNTKYLCTDSEGNALRIKYEALSKMIDKIWVNLIPVVPKPAPAINNSVVFYNSLGQQLSTGTLLSVDTSQTGMITISANIAAMFDLFSIAQISFTQNNTFSTYSVSLSSNASTPDTHYSFLVQLEFNLI